jgi:copper homeostasis protein
MAVDSMNRKYILEISIESLEAALAAERGGANRVELCGDLTVGGVTPGAELFRAIRGQVHIPIFSMVRPRAGDFVYSSAEFAEMKRSISAAKEFGVDGVVLGILTEKRCIDSERTRQLVEFAKPLPVTYHRAFDEAADLHQALEDVIQSGAKRILTSGGAKSALEGAAVLAKLIEAAKDRVVIMPGAGISDLNIEQVAQRTKAREFHCGLSAVLPYGSEDYSKFEDEVRKLAKRIARLGGNQTTRT